jgi:hypothetical protein
VATQHGLCDLQTRCEEIAENRRRPKFSNPVLLADAFSFFCVFSALFLAAAQAANEARAGSVSSMIMKSKVNITTKVLGGHGRVMVLSFEVKSDYWARKSYYSPDFARICTATEKD